MIKAHPLPLYKYSRISGIMGGTFLRFTAFLHFFCFSSLTKTRNGCILCKQHVVAVAQLVRASGCGPEGRRFESDQPPHLWDHGGARKRISDFFCSESGTFRKIIVDPLCVPQSSRCCASDCPAHLLRFLVVAVASAPARLRRVAQKVQGSSVFGGVAEKNIGRQR